MPHQLSVMPGIPRCYVLKAVEMPGEASANYNDDFVQLST